MGRASVCCLLTGALVALPDWSAGQAPADFVVIVNADNPNSAMSREGVRRLFLKKARRWPDASREGTKKGWSAPRVVPIDLSTTSSARRAFTKDVLGLSLSELQDYWLKQTLSASDVPPIVKSSETEVIDMVRTEPSAIAYVSPAAKLPAEVKALKVTQ